MYISAQLGHPDPPVVRLAQQLQEHWAAGAASNAAQH